MAAAVALALLIALIPGRLGRNLALPMNRVSKYFPNTYTPQQMQDTIINLLESWLRMKRKQEEKHGGKA